LVKDLLLFQTGVESWKAPNSGENTGNKKRKIEEGGYTLSLF